MSSFSSTAPEIDPLEIRRASPEDAARLTVIARAAKAHWGYPAAWLTTWEPVLTITPDYLGHAIVFVGTRGGAPIGFYALEPRGDRWSLEHMWVEPRRAWPRSGAAPLRSRARHDPRAAAGSPGHRGRPVRGRLLRPHGSATDGYRGRSGGRRPDPSAPGLRDRRQHPSPRAPWLMHA